MYCTKWPSYRGEKGCVLNVLRPDNAGVFTTMRFALSIAVHRLPAACAGWLGPCGRNRGCCKRMKTLLARFVCGLFAACRRKDEKRTVQYVEDSEAGVFKAQVLKFKLPEGG